MDGKIVAEGSRYLPELDDYVLAAEIAGVALAGGLIDREKSPQQVIIETDNPDVARVVEGHYRPKQVSRIPPGILDAARRLCTAHRVTFKLLPRNSTPGLRKANKLASDRLWKRRS